MLSIRADKYASTFKHFGDSSLDVSCGDGVFSLLPPVVSLVNPATCFNQ